VILLCKHACLRQQDTGPSDTACGTAAMQPDTMQDRHEISSAHHAAGSAPSSEDGTLPVDTFSDLYKAGQDGLDVLEQNEVPTSADADIQSNEALDGYSTDDEDVAVACAEVTACTTAEAGVSGESTLSRASIAATEDSPGDSEAIHDDIKAVSAAAHASTGQAALNNGLDTEADVADIAGALIEINELAKHDTSGPSSNPSSFGSVDPDGVNANTLASSKRCRCTVGESQIVRVTC
jgi:hypothetical protein